MVWLVFAPMLIIPSLQVLVHGDPIVPCYFIFGDSLADSGNNNNLTTKAKVNYSPYGVDFKGGVATGRFTNGETYVDLIAKKIGFTDFIPSFATAKGNDILRGVNYASGASGIRNDTGTNQGVHIAMDAQLANHKTTIAAISRILGAPNKTTELLNSCLYTVGIGSNDYINNYFLSGSPLPSNYNHQQYAESLMDLYHRQLQVLHGAGARKVALFGLGPVGCTPFAVAGTNKKECSKEMNDAAQTFNSLMKPLVNKLNQEFADSKFTFLDIGKTIIDLSTTTKISLLSHSCCLMDNTTGLCVANSIPCTDRSLHAFWDGFHPTQVVNRLTVAKAWLAIDPDVAYPTNLSNLLQG